MAALLAKKYARALPNAAALADRAVALVCRSGPAAYKCAGPQREFLPQHSQPPPSSLPGS